MNYDAIDPCLFLTQTMFTSNVLLAHCTSFKSATKHQNYFGDIWSVESKQDNSLARSAWKKTSSLNNPRYCGNLQTWSVTHILRLVFLFPPLQRTMLFWETVEQKWHHRPFSLFSFIKPFNTVNIVSVLVAPRVTTYGKRLLIKMVIGAESLSDSMKKMQPLGDCKSTSSTCSRLHSNK